METVCEGKQWDVLLVERKDGTIEGALPYLHGRRRGLRYILQPRLTQYNGPWFNLPEGLSECARLDFENRVGGILAEQLDALKINFFSQHFSPQVTNWLPFHWKGYRQTTRYTYRFPSIADPDSLYANASRARRQNMADLQQGCTIDPDFAPATFARIHREYFEHKCGHDLLPADLIERLCRTTLDRGQGLLWALRNPDGKAVNVSFVAFDDHCAYALMSAITPDAPRNSQTFLFWQIIRHLSSRTRAFDFEGSMEPGNEYFYRTFGTVQTPYFAITRYRPRILSALL